MTGESGYRRTISSIARPDLLLFWTIDGIGRGATASPVLWQDGATVRLPVISSSFLTGTCVSRVQRDGSVVATGFNVTAGTPTFVTVRHTGGLPGTDVVLSRATQTDPVYGGITCTTDLTSNTLAADGGIAGYLTEAGVRRAAYWNSSDVPLIVPLLPGEVQATGVAAATGGRIVIQSERADGSAGLALWRNGTRNRWRSRRAGRWPRWSS